MKKQTISLIFTLILGLTLSVGLSYLHAAWSDPAGTPPAGNLYAPITTSDGAQVKEGGLSVNTFTATKHAQFDQRTFFRGSLKGGTPATTGVLQIGGTPANADDQYRVRTNVTGDVYSLLTLGSTELISNEKNRLCGDTEGHVVLCPQYSPIPLWEVRTVSARSSYPGAVDQDQYALVCRADLGQPAPSGGVTARVQVEWQGTSRLPEFCDVVIPAGEYGAEHEQRTRSIFPIARTCAVDAWLGSVPFSGTQINIHPDAQC